LLLFAATVALVCVTRDLVADAERTAERQLRAYVGPVNRSFSVSCDTCDSYIGNPNIELPKVIPYGAVVWKMKNYGPTPGRQLAICGNLLPVDISKDSNYSGGEAAAGVVRDKLFRGCDSLGPQTIIGPTIWPNEERDYIGPIETRDDIIAIASIIQGKIPGLYFGRLTYEDIFGHVRHTYICRRFLFPAPRANALVVMGCNSVGGPQDD